jgi:branched-chain amino acid transport system permease protein
VNGILAGVTGSLRRFHGSFPPGPWLVAFVVLLPVPLLAANLYQVHLVNIIFLNIIVATGLNIVKGFCGQVTVGHFGLYAIGAYASALVSIHLGVSFWVALPLAVLITGVAGAIVALPSFRLEGAYLALATLGMGESVRIYISATEFLGQTFGISNIPYPQIGDFLFDTPARIFYIIMPISLIGIYLSMNILRSGVGRAFKAVRDDPISAATSGVAVRKYKLIAFVISAFYAGCAGSLYAHLVTYIHPDNFTILIMIMFLLMVVLGGLGHIWGGVIGAVLVTMIYEWTRPFPEYQMLVFGMSAVLIVIYMPKGIGGLLDRFFATRKFIEITAGKADASSD